MVTTRTLAGGLAAAALAVPATTTVAQAADTQRTIDDRANTTLADQSAAQRLIGSEAARLMNRPEDRVVLRFRRTSEGYEPIGRVDPRDVLADGDRRLLAQKIGRASCRERVELWVVVLRVRKERGSLCY